MASLPSEVVLIPSSILLRHLSQSMKNVSLWIWWQGRPLSGGQCHGSATSGKLVLTAQKAPSGFAGLLQGGKGSRRGNPYLQFQSGARPFLLPKVLLSDMHWGAGVSRWCTNMAGEALEKAGMHFDDLNRIRVLDEDTASQVSSDYQFEFQTHMISIFQSLRRNWDENYVAQAQELREVCQDFLGDIGDFQKIADSFIVIFDAVSKEVETEKMKVSWIIRNSGIHQFWMRFEISHEIKFNPKCMQPTIKGWCVNL